MSYNSLDFIMKFEDGECELDEVIEGFSELIKTGLINHLQGFYGRTAYALIEEGYLNPDGSIPGPYIGRTDIEV